MKADFAGPVRELVRRIEASARRIVRENGLEWIPPRRFMSAVRGVFEAVRPVAGPQPAPERTKRAEV